MTIAMAFIGKKPDNGEISQSSPETVTCMFNPENLRVAVSKQQPTEVRADGDANGTEVVGTDANNVRLDVTLLFDTTESGADVRSGPEGSNGTSILKTLASPTDGAPAPVVIFAWGSFRFEGVIESLTETLEFWSSEGIPLRSSLQLAIAGGGLDTTAAAPETFATVEAPVGGWGTTEIATRGGDSGAQRDISRENGVENPRFPSALDKAGKAIGQVNDNIGEAQRDIDEATGELQEGIDGLNEDLEALGGSASFGSGGGAGAGLSLGVSAGIGMKAAAGFKLGFSAGASIGFGFGASAGGGAGFGIGAGAGFGVGLNVGIGLGADGFGLSLAASPGTSGSSATASAAGGNATVASMALPGSTAAGMPGAPPLALGTSANASVGYSGLPGMNAATSGSAPSIPTMAGVTVGGSVQAPSFSTGPTITRGVGGAGHSVGGARVGAGAIPVMTAPESRRSLATLSASQGAFAGLGDRRERPARLNLSALSNAPKTIETGPETQFDVLGRASNAPAIEWRRPGAGSSVSAARSIRLI